MKNLLLTTFWVCSLTAVSFGSPVASKTIPNNIKDGATILQQDRTDVGFEQLMYDLQRVHKAVYSLPYSYEHIRAVLMAEIEAQRLTIAPHFPQRTAYGDDQDEGRRLFKEWYINYPQECTAYIQYVDQFILIHSN